MAALAEHPWGARGYPRPSWEQISGQARCPQTGKMLHLLGGRSGGGSGDPRTSLARLGCPEGAPDPAARPGVGAARPGRRCREALIFANRSLISRSGPPAGVARARPSTPSKLRFGFPSWGEAGGARSCSPPQPGRYGVGGPWALGGSQSVGSHVWPS